MNGKNRDQINEKPTFEIAASDLSSIIHHFLHVSVVDGDEAEEDIDEEDQVDECFNRHPSY